MPIFVRKFLTDFIETGVAALLALNLILPTSGADVLHIGLAIGAALAGAALAAARRAYPSFVEYVRSKLGTTENTDGAA